MAVLLLAGPAAAQDVRVRDADARGFVVPAGSVSVNPAAPAQPSRVPGAYTLGIMARNTPAGVEVVSAQPGSVALASGIQPGDVIVTVAGYQVGYVGDRLYDVTDEITRRVNAAGQVPLLVRNGRTGALAPLVVQYGARSRCTITGVLTTDATGPTGLIPRDQITQWFQSYLGRQPRPYEVDIWLADLQQRYDGAQGIRLTFVEQLLQQPR